MENNGFDERTFNWKKTIYDISERLIKVELSLENHLRSHEIRHAKKDKIIFAVIAGFISLIVSLTILGTKYILAN